MTNTTIKPRVTSRAEDTRRKIYEAAMEMFREKGFEETTMRDIAGKAGVALGGAYYYYSSKDAIVLAFYREMQETSTPLVGGALTDKKKLKERIRAVLDQRLKLLAPNRKFCAALFRHAPDGADPLSPWPRLPYLLWLYQMALIMFWLYDRSPDQQRTQRLMEKSLGLLVNLLRISSLPLMKPLRKTALELVEAVSA